MIMIFLYIIRGIVSIGIQIAGRNLSTCDESHIAYVCIWIKPRFFQPVILCRFICISFIIFKCARKVSVIDFILLSNEREYSRVLIIIRTHILIHVPGNIFYSWVILSEICLIIFIVIILTKHFLKEWKNDIFLCCFLSHSIHH